MQKIQRIQINTGLRGVISTRLITILPMALLLVAVGAAGCAFSGFKQFTPPSISADGVVDPGGKMAQRTFVFTPPFATHAGEQRFSYEAKPDGEWTLTNGQEGEAQGGDPTAIITAIGAIYTSAFSARPATQNGFSADQAQELNRLFQAIGGRLDLLGADVKALKAPPTE